MSHTFQPEPLPQGSPPSQGVDPRGLQEAMEYVGSIAAEHGNSQSLAVRNGCVIWAGPDIDNKHTIWSCTKSFMSMTLGLLIDDGRCTLQTRAADWAPALKEHYPDVTLRQFANFTSGYRQAGDDPMAPFTPGPPLYPPGTMFHYSQSSDELANILTRIAAEPLRDLFRRRIAEPIGLDPAGWSWGDWGEVDGLTVCGGSGSYEKGISITARELAKVGVLFVGGGNWRGRQLLSRRWVEESTSPQVAVTTPVYDRQAWYQRLPGSYGLNWWVNGPTPQGRLMWPAAPPRTAAIQGNLNNFCFVIPEWQMVLVRMGTDARITNDLYDGFFERMRKALGPR